MSAAAITARSLAVIPSPFAVQRRSTTDPPMPRSASTPGQGHDSFQVSEFPTQSLYPTQKDFSTESEKSPTFGLPGQPSRPDAGHQMPLA
jgi:hypothetical protein